MTLVKYRLQDYYDFILINIPCEYKWNKCTYDWGLHLQEQHLQPVVSVHSYQTFLSSKLGKKRHKHLDDDGWLLFSEVKFKNTFSINADHENYGFLWLIEDIGPNTFLGMEFHESQYNYILAEFGPLTFTLPLAHTNPTSSYFH